MPAPSRPSVLLFDIDGTLVTIGGAGRRAMERAFEAICGSKEACPTFSFGGRTDKGIVGDGLSQAGIHPSDEALEKFFELYHRFLREEIPLSTTRKALPGCQDLLKAVSEYKNTALGLGTGNTREGAYIKLGAVGLDSYFSFGGFGCDHADRREIIKLGISRGAQRLGLPPTQVRAVVIGDTPRDISAAREAGAESIAVATGEYSLAQLVDHSPTELFPDLEHPEIIRALFGQT